jgi:hypothetical protein
MRWAVVYFAGLVLLGVAAMAGCPRCGKKHAPQGIQVSRRWAAERGMCYCAIPPGEIPLEPEDRQAVEELLMALPNPHHPWCGDSQCEVCKR